MGLGHVPPRSLREAGEGDDVPRFQYRRAGAQLSDLTEHRQRLARLGERIAARFLQARGAAVLERNLMVGRGELDLLVLLDDRHVAVEVKTVGPAASAVHPIDRISGDKLLQVRRLANSLPRACGLVRVDFVGVALNASGVQVNWRTNVA